MQANRIPRYLEGKLGLRSGDVHLCVVADGVTIPLTYGSLAMTLGSLNRTFPIGSDGFLRLEYDVDDDFESEADSEPVPAREERRRRRH